MRARGSRLFVILVAVAIIGIVVAALVMRQRLRCAGFPGGGPVAAELPPEQPPGVLRIATWNIRNFPLDERPQDPELGFSRRTNICDLEAVLSGLDADVIGLAEIRDSRRFPPILRRSGNGRDYRVVLSRSGSDRLQRLAIAWDARRLEALGTPVEVTTVAEGKGARPALALRLRSREEPGLDFTVVQVHLRAAPAGYATRLRQYHALAAWAREWVAESGDPDLLVMGDFNTTGATGGDSDIAEIARVEALLGAVGLRRLVNPLGCSEYWEGPGRWDGIHVASLLDHVFAGGLPRLPASAEVRTWLHCARLQCGPLESRPGSEDATYWDVSDHCPITLDLPLR